jgi:hypothetical protein
MSVAAIQLALGQAVGIKGKAERLSRVKRVHEVFI